MKARGGGASELSSSERSRALGAVLGFVLCLVAAEATSRRLLATGSFYRLVDLSGTLTGAAELEDRIRSLWRGRNTVPLLGDSVLGASALAEHRVGSPRLATLTAQLRARVTPRPVAPLSADGLLLPDLEGLAERLPDGVSSPAEALVLLNVRMFARRFEAGPKALSRDFLAPIGSSALVDARRSSPTEEERLAHRIDDGASRLLALFRLTRAASASWWFPSRKHAVQRLIEKALPSEDDPDLASATLRMTVAEYYAPRAWNGDSEAFRSLDRLLRGLAARGTRSIVVLAPQNPEFMAEVAATPFLADNRALLARRVAAALSGRGVFVDLADRLPAKDFLDHCHLTAEGNARAALEISALFGASSS